MEFFLGYEVCANCLNIIKENDKACIIRKHGKETIFCETCSNYAVNSFMKWYEECIQLIPVKKEPEHQSKYPSLNITEIERNE